jgi:hypothetical protein
MIDDDDCGAIGGRWDRSTWRKPALVPYCQPQIPNDLTRARTRAVAVGSRRLAIAWIGQVIMFEIMGYIGVDGRMIVKLTLQKNVT